MKRSAVFILTFVGICTLIGFAIQMAFPATDITGTRITSGTYTGISTYHVSGLTFGPGHLEWSTGKLVFKGDAERSARVFFDGYLKPMVDRYIREQLQPGTCAEKLQ